MELLKEGLPLASSAGHSGRLEGRTNRVPRNLRELDHVTHRFTELISVRPDVRYEHAFSARPYDNGIRRGQLMFAIDTMLRF